jgi:hypothetical protein
MRLGSRRRRAPGLGVRRRCTLGLGSRTIRGTDGTMVSRVTKERERAQGQKLLSVVRESVGPEILVHGT